MKTALYRHFAADGALLYVGISLSAVQRLSQHRQSAAWFDEIARVDVEWLQTREAALRAEAAAIGRENPRHNIVRPACATVTVVRKPGRVQGFRPSFAIHNQRTRRRDGNYFDRAVAIEMLAWWRCEFPLEAFELVEAAPGVLYGATGHLPALRPCIFLQSGGKPA